MSLTILVICFGQQPMTEKKQGNDKLTSIEEEEKNKVSAENGVAPSSTNNNDSTIASPSNSIPSILQLLLTLSSYVSGSILPPSTATALTPSSTSSPDLMAGPPPLVQQLSAEVLALASSDALVAPSPACHTNLPKLTWRS